MTKFIEVSHIIEDGMVTYPGLPAPVISDYLSREDSKKLYAEGTQFHIGSIEMIANTGTYIDSPFHRFDGQDDLADMPLEKVVNLDGVVLRIKETGERAIDLSHVDAARIQGKAVLLQTGWSKHWRTDRYTVEYPFVDWAAAEFLRDSGVVLVGIDTVNIDDNRDGSRPAHTTLLEAGIPIVEHLTNLDLVPESEFRFFAPPVRIRGMGSFPVRAFVLIPDQD